MSLQSCNFEVNISNYGKSSRASKNTTIHLVLTIKYHNSPRYHNKIPQSTLFSSLNATILLVLVIKYHNPPRCHHKIPKFHCMKKKRVWKRCALYGNVVFFSENVIDCGVSFLRCETYDSLTQSQRSRDMDLHSIDPKNTEQQFYWLDRLIERLQVHT